MRAQAPNTSLSLAVAVLVLGLFCSGCAGGGSSTPAPVPITSSEALAVATEVDTAFISSTGGISSNRCPTFGLKGAQEADCTVPVAVVVPCTGGGSVSVTGSLNGDVDFTNSGGMTGTLTAVPTACAVPGTDLTVTGEPDLTVSGTVIFFYGGVVSVGVTQTGTVSYGPSPSGSCPVNLALTASFEGNDAHTVKGCQVTGTACGATVNQSCM